ncbi:hypothetical protein BXZ70DRAFT_465927 [Cristinia sonorae]|uniref:F-box domain-containing protein n=1 Tax=Cristinia sonorae TaxID=1940300 RepID=A0A8K0XLY7_9AGAR|nr:hypothetical protein BXZ70DRAFT_465927 [Cristinia sonorae]
MIESSASPGLAATLQAIDSQIESHKAAIRDLKNRRNGIIPVAQLPPELLARVFLWCRYAMGVDVKSQFRWTLVRKVCRRWNEVAISSPELWSMIYVTQDLSVKTVKTCLERSRMALLDMRIFVSNPLDYNVFSLAISHAYRARMLQLEMSEETYEAVAPHFPSFAPNLQRLILQRPYNFVRSKSLLPLPVTRCDMPALRYLSLDRYQIPWGPDTFPKSITCLIVSSTPVQGSELPALIQAIASLVELECLRLQVTFVSPPSVVPVGQHHLPQMKELTLDTDIRFVPLILDSLVLPPPVKISLFVHCHHGDLVNALASSFATKLRPLLVTGCAKGSDGIDGVCLKDGEIQFSMRESGVVKDVSHLSISLIGAASKLYSLCAEPPLRELSRMMIDLDHIPRPSPMLAFQNVDTLVLGRDPSAVMTTKTVISLLLNVRKGRKVASARTQLVLPKLKRIDLVGINFCERSFDEEQVLEQPSSLFIEDLCGVLRWRERTGAKVEVVSIKTCYNVYEVEIATLREVVAVEWDGVVQSSTVDSDDEEMHSIPGSDTSSDGQEVSHTPVT